MNELIEKIIERLEERETFYRNRMDKMGGTERDVEDWGSVKSYRDAISIVKELAAEYNDGWIPVVERLPEKSGEYTVTQERYSLFDGEFLCVEVANDVQFDADTKKWYRGKMFSVIAWKHLPTPYQPKGE